ncbi:DUF7344 domain-containing protein [Halorussus ruber]|uniref:DUF7344 domain-containing protein n=1 Tax=Halorussus ruber TaxID=1126238 RepID=UPI001092E2EF|nr:hypothetical protein [Halorussus ruber]
MVEDRPDGPAESVSELFDALRRSNCRYALYYLQDRETATLAELATVVASWTQARAADPEIVTPEDRQRVMVSLHHADLPALEDAGLVRYDFDSKTVTAESLPEMADAILEKSLVYERLADREPDHSDRRESGNEKEPNDE